MNEAERSRFLDALRTDDDFRAAVRRELLTDELLNLPATVAALVDVTAELRQDFTSLTQSVADYMKRTVQAIEDLNVAVQDSIGGLRNEMIAGFTAVDAKFDQVDAELRDVKSDISDMKSDIRDIKGQLAS